MNKEAATEHHLRPVHRANGESRQWANRLLKMVSGTPLGAIERSFKMTASGFLSNRFLVGLPRAMWSQVRFADLSERLSMPNELWQRLGAELNSANFLGLAFEEGERDCVFKIYVEYPVPIEPHVPLNAPAALLYRGLKWNPQSARALAITDYWWKPRMSARAITERLKPHLAGITRPDIADVVHEIVRIAGTREDAREFNFVEATEPGGSRASFDLNLYAAKLEMRELGGLIAKAAEAFGLDVRRIGPQLAESRGDFIGHLSAGTGRDGEDFLTLYHDEPAF